VLRIRTSLGYSDLCNAIADAYDSIYAAPDRFGVTNHDRADLVVECLYWLADRAVVYPIVGT
jgi:hypothetical protein